MQTICRNLISYLRLCGRTLWPVKLKKSFLLHNVYIYSLISVFLGQNTFLSTLLWNSYFIFFLPVGDPIPYPFLRSLHSDVFVGDVWVKQTSVWEVIHRRYWISFVFRTVRAKYVLNPWHVFGSRLCAWGRAAEVTKCNVQFLWQLPDHVVLNFRSVGI